MTKSASTGATIRIKIAQKHYRRNKLVSLWLDELGCHEKSILFQINSNRIEFVCFSVLSFHSRREAIDSEKTTEWRTGTTIWNWSVFYYRQTSYMG